MAQQKKSGAKPIKAPSRKTEVTREPVKLSVGKRVLKTHTAPVKTPFRLGQVLKPAQFKAEIDSPNSAYIEIVPLIERGKAAKNAQRKGVENNQKNKMARQERFIKIFREEKAAAGVRTKKETVVKAAIAKFSLGDSNISLRAAWDYIKDIN